MGNKILKNIKFYMFDSIDKKIIMFFFFYTKIIYIKNIHLTINLISYCIDTLEIL
jgi:hypothetical protein